MFDLAQDAEAGRPVDGKLDRLNPTPTQVPDVQHNPIGSQVKSRCVEIHSRQVTCPATTACQRAQHRGALQAAEMVGRKPKLESALLDHDPLSRFDAARLQIRQRGVWVESDLSRRMVQKLLRHCRKSSIRPNPACLLDWLRMLGKYARC
jgi:hypothetical protein